LDKASTEDPCPCSSSLGQYSVGLVLPFCCWLWISLLSFSAFQTPFFAIRSNLFRLFLFNRRGLESSSY
jgi:hypothetical protein